MYINISHTQHRPRLPILNCVCLGITSAEQSYRMYRPKSMCTSSCGICLAMPSSPRTLLLIAQHLIRLCHFRELGLCCWSLLQGYLVWVDAHSGLTVRLADLKGGGGKTNGGIAYCTWGSPSRFPDQDASSGIMTSSHIPALQCSVLMAFCSRTIPNTHWLQPAG